MACCPLVAALSTELIILADANGLIRYASPSCAATLGYDAAAVVGHNIFEHIHPDDLTEARVCMTHGRGEDAGTNAAAFRVRHADSSWRWVEARAAPTIAGGRPTMVIVGHDITERVRLMAELFRLQKLDRVEHMTSAIIHDVNNLLTGIAALAELGIQTLPPGHETRDDLEAITHAVDHAATLAGQLGSFARKPSPAPQTLDLNSLINNLTPLLRSLIGPGIVFCMAVQPMPSNIIGDPVQLEQVVLNLVINARDAMPGGGQLRIETTNVTLSDTSASLRNHHQPGSYVRLTISDTGIGMDAATQARIFEPYFTTKAPGRGSGLGLATCAEIIKRHNGSIGVDSAPGQGTIVTIDLPCVIEDRTETERLLKHDAESTEIEYLP